MNNSIKAPASKNLHKLWHLKILSNSTQLKADAIWRKFANVTSSVNPYFTCIHLITLYTNLSTKNCSYSRLIHSFIYAVTSKPCYLNLLRALR